LVPACPVGRFSPTAGDSQYFITNKTKDYIK